MPKRKAASAPASVKKYLRSAVAKACRSSPSRAWVNCARAIAPFTTYEQHRASALLNLVAALAEARGDPAAIQAARERIQRLVEQDQMVLDLGINFVYPAFLLLATMGSGMIAGAAYRMLLLVTTGSIMVTCPWFTEVAAYVKSHPDADSIRGAQLACEGARICPDRPERDSQSLADLLVAQERGDEFADLDFAAGEVRDGGRWGP